jgi:FixJ family two-component response regulator
MIVISAMGQQSVVEEAMKLGADKYISKPFNINTIVDDISRLTTATAMA